MADVVGGDTHMCAILQDGNVSCTTRVIPLRQIHCIRVCCEAVVHVPPRLGLES